jgi:hypothetical protein
MVMMEEKWYHPIGRACGGAVAVHRVGQRRCDSEVSCTESSASQKGGIHTG